MKYLSRHCMVLLLGLAAFLGKFAFNLWRDP